MLGVKELEVIVTAPPTLDVGGTWVGLLLIRLSTSADVTDGLRVVAKVFASGGTIGMKGMG